MGPDGAGPNGDGPAGARAPGSNGAEGAGGGGGADVWAGHFAGLVAAFFTAFSPTFWTNATEAETYSTSSFLMIFTVWLILVWGRLSGTRAVRNGLFILLYYLLCLSMAIYLGTPLVLPGIVLFAFLVDHHTFASKRWVAAVVAVVTILLHPGLLPNLGVGIWGSLVVAVVVSVLLFGRRWSAVSHRGPRDEAAAVSESR